MSFSSFPPPLDTSAAAASSSSSSSSSGIVQRENTEVTVHHDSAGFFLTLPNGKSYDITLRIPGQTDIKGAITEAQAQHIANLLNQATAKERGSAEMRKSLLQSDVHKLDIEIPSSQNDVAFKVHSSSAVIYQGTHWGIDKNIISNVYNVFKDTFSLPSPTTGLGTSSASLTDRSAASASDNPESKQAAASHSSSSSPAPAPAGQTSSLSPPFTGTIAAPPARAAATTAAAPAPENTDGFTDIADLDISTILSQGPGASSEDLEALKKRLPKAARERALASAPLVQKYSDGRTLYAEQVVSRHPTIQQAAQYAQSNVTRLEKQSKEEDLSEEQLKELTHYRKIVEDAESYQKDYGDRTHPKTWADCNYFRHSIRDTDFMTAVDTYVPALPNARTTRVIVGKKFIASVADLQSDAEKAAYYRSINPRRLDEEIGKEKAEAVRKADEQLLSGKCTVAKHTRVGVLNDERQGFFSLKFINQIRGISRKLRGAIGLGIDSPDTDKLKAERDSLIVDKANHIIKTVSKKVEVVGANPDLRITKPEEIGKVIKEMEERIETLRVLAAEETSGGKILALKANINKLQSALYALQRLNSMIDPAGLEQVYEDRMRIMRDKMLLLVGVQVKEHPELVKNGQFKMAHVGLIEPEHATLDESGWMHDEGVAMEDMAEIFNEFDGKVIKFSDTESPYVEGDIVFLPRSMQPPASLGQKDSEEGGFKLTSIFMNVAVQTSKLAGFGATPNRGSQLEINKKAEERLAREVRTTQKESFTALRASGATPPAFGYSSADLGTKKFGSLLTALTRFNSPTKKMGRTVPKDGDYLVARDLTKGVLEAGFALSTGCASAKDRGGTVSGLLVQDALERQVTTSETDPTKGMSRALKRKCFSDMLKPTSMTAHVIFENTGIPNPKVDISKVYVREMYQQLDTAEWYQSRKLYQLWDRISLTVTVGGPALKAAKITGNVWENSWKRQEAARLQGTEPTKRLVAARTARSDRELKERASRMEEAGKYARSAELEQVEEESKGEVEDVDDYDVDDDGVDDDDVDDDGDYADHNAGQHTVRFIKAPDSEDYMGLEPPRSREVVEGVS